MAGVSHDLNFTFSIDASGNLLKYAQTDMVSFMQKLLSAALHAVEQGAEIIIADDGSIVVTSLEGGGTRIRILLRNMETIL